MAAALAVYALLLPLALTMARDETVDELKERVAKASVSDRPALCIQISERQLDAADRLYAAGDDEKAQATISDVIAYAEQARDSAIQSHKREKQSEIAIRKMTRKLTNLKHTVTHEEQPQIQNAIDRLERIRDDLLAAMFPNGVKK
jgi:polyhydroxyalkanoate synthesis regulator phasin